MRSYRNTAAIEAGTAAGDHVRVRPVLAALVLALAITLGTAVAIDVTGPQTVPGASSYQGDWKDAFLSSATTTYEGDWKDAFLGGSATTTYEGDWKDSYLGSVDAPARTHSGDWKDLFLPEVAGR